MTVVPGQGYLSSVGGRNTKKDRPDAREVAEFHVNADTDGSPKSLHHTLGPGPNQAAVGNHTHDAGASSGLSGYATAAHTHDLAYWKANVPWIALPYSGGWADFLNGYVVGSYRIVADEVQCRGMMKHATVTTTGTFATLPVGFRPTGLVQYWCPGSGGGNVDVRIANTGVMTITAYGANASGASIALNTIRFSIL